MNQQLTRSQRLSRLDVKASPYLYISPFFILFFIVGLFPLVYTAWVSVHDWHLIGGQGEMVGLTNYIDVLQQPNFFKALRNTFSIFLLSSVPQVLAAIVIAYLLDTNLRAKTFWRMGVLLPYVVAPVAVSLIFAKIFADQSGLVNAVLEILGTSPIGWHADPFAAHVAIATMVNFRWTGYNTLILLAAMQAIPRDLYEAATIDGAKRVRQFFSITIPMVRPTMLFVIITSTIGGLQIFTEPRLFDTNLQFQGGADYQYQTLTMYVFNTSNSSTDPYPRAAAATWIIVLIIVTIALVNFGLTRLAQRRSER